MGSQQVRSKSGRAILKQGDQFFQDGDFTKAITCYQKAIELDSNFVKPYLKLGDVLANSAIQRLDEAVIAYSDAVRLKPNNAGYNCRLGQALFKQGNLSQAIDYFKKAIELNPENVVFRTKLATALKENSQFDEAIECYLQIVDLTTDNFEHYLEIALILSQQRKWDSAIEYCMKILTIHPRHVAAYKVLSSILEQQGNFNKNEVKQCNSGYLPNSIIKKFCGLDKQDIINSSSTASNDVDHLEVEPRVTINLPPPKTIHNRIHHRFVTQKDFRSLFVTFLDNAGAWGDGKNSAIISSEDKLVHNLSTVGTAELAFGASKFMQPTVFESTVAFLPHRYSFSRNYYHWMLQIIPRIGLLTNSKIDLETIDEFAFYKIKSGFQIETLDILGIPKSKIFETCDTAYLRAKKLIVPSPLVGRPTKFACNFLRDKFLKQSLSTKDNEVKIYISREKSPYRKITNEDEFMNYLTKYGFIKVTLETLSVREQASLLAKSQVVIAPHGAGLTNLVFCQPRTKVIEIFPQSYVRNCYQVICHHNQLDYYYLIAEESDPNLKNIQIDISQLHQLFLMANLA